MHNFKPQLIWDWIVNKKKSYYRFFSLLNLQKEMFHRHSYLFYTLERIKGTRCDKSNMLIMWWEVR